MYPSASDLRKLKKYTLRSITEIGEFGRVPDIQLAARNAAVGIDEDRGPLNVHLGFALDIRLRADRNSKPIPRRIDLGALVGVSTDQKVVTSASYSLLICRTADPRRGPIVRKLHFDYEPVAYRNVSEPKPTAHMQVCGRLSPQHLAAGYSEMRLQSLYPRFEKPRIPAAPTSIALLLNWLLLEFQTDLAAQAILRNARWRVLVASAERQVLYPYYSSAAAFLRSTGDKKRRFLQTHLYEMTVD